MAKGKAVDMSRLKKKLDRLGKKFEEYQVAAVQEATFLVHETAVKLVSEQKGTPAVRYNPKRNVTVSKPGSPPNTDTGRLVQSIKFDFTNRGRTGQVGTNLKYGAALEFGTKNMAARPWLSAAVNKTRKKVQAIFLRAANKALKEAVS